MRKTLKIILLIASLSVLSSCFAKNREDSGKIPDIDGVKMRAKIKNIDEKIEVDVIESEYTSGPHLVITFEETEFLNKSGEKIEKSDLQIGDTVEIIYGGQVMMSYPPQIVAKRIVII